MSPVVSTVTDNPVVTYILSKSSTGESFLVQDATRALEVYNDTVSNNIPNTYFPAVGDTVSISGYCDSYHGLFQAQTNGTVILNVSKTGTASLPALTTFSAAGMQNGNPVGQQEQSMLGTLFDVTFVSPTGTFAADTNYSVTDGTYTADIYIGYTSSLVGAAIPTTPVNIYGYMGQFDSVRLGSDALSGSYNYYELDTLTMTAVPEPVSFAGFLAAGLALLVPRRRT